VADHAALAEGAGVGEGMRGDSLGYTAAGTRRRVRLYRVDKPLGIQDVVQAAGSGLGIVQVTPSAIPGIARSALWTHQGESHLCKIIHAPVSSDDGVGLSRVLQILAGVNAMNQQIEVDALRRFGWLGGIRCGRPLRRIGPLR
jgi:hypothetical protein